MEKTFSKKASLKDVDSDKGIGRAIILSPFDKGGGLVGGYVSKKEADKADDEGATDDEILRRARNKGLKAGAITGAAVSAAAYKPLNYVGEKYGLKLANKALKKINIKIEEKQPTVKKGKGLRGIARGVIIGSALGALGGRNAASVNTKDRLRKRSAKENEQNNV